MRAIAIVILGQLAWLWPCYSEALEPVPNKLVVLSFDDASKSHFTVVRPILKQYGFNATFFVTEGFDFLDNKKDYMTWDEIAQLHRDGFEIGNHTRDHLTISEKTIGSLDEQLQGIEDRCVQHGIPRPASFAYPGNGIHRDALPILKRHGILFARRGGAPEYAYDQGRGVGYEPGLDHPLLIPSAGDARPRWLLDDFQRAVNAAQHGRIAVLQFHGVPDTAHDWVNTSEESFRAFMNYLAVNGYRVIALRDLARYVDPQIAPTDPWGVINDRSRQIANSDALYEVRTPSSDSDTKWWLDVMLTHGFSRVEIGAATGWDEDRVAAAIDRLHAAPIRQPDQPDGPSLVLPYPGGRHPRRAFLDGAIRPKRETKASIFTPWKNGGYAVLDVPEAIWTQQGEGRQLLYLAHTHVPTIWSKQGIELERLEWERADDGRLTSKRTLPNGVEFGARIMPNSRGAQLELWLRNPTAEKLSGLLVQNCVMLKECRGFDATTPDRVKIAKPWVACHDGTNRRWVITGWEPCVRPWANPPCPCIHSDPQFPDCEPGQTQRVYGCFSFYEGNDLDSELARLSKELHREIP